LPLIGHLTLPLLPPPHPTPPHPTLPHHHRLRPTTRKRADPTLHLPPPLPQGHYQEMGNILDLIPYPDKDQQLPEEPQEGEEQEEEEEEEQQVAQVPKGKHVLQTFVFSATLTLPLSLRKRLRKGGGGAGGGSATLENLMNRLVFRGRPRVVDLTTERKVGG
jgi:hypothetical protein